MREHKGKNIIDFPSDYIVIDTETTGLDFEDCDIIEICAVRYSNGECVNSYSSLVKPRARYTIDPETHELIPHFVDSYITSLTGITDDMLANAPELRTVMPAFMDFIGNTTLVAHNAHFDINFIYDACHKHCSTDLSNNFVDTLRIARKVFPELPHHRLSDIAEICNVSQPHAHRAEADCIVTAQCFEIMKAKALHDRSLDEFRNLFHTKHSNYRASLASISANVDSIDDSNPIFGKTVVFTGALSSMSRKAAFQIVANLGGIPDDKISMNTNYLVIGAADFAKSVKDGKTTKMKKAESYRLKGADISIVSESAFFDLISDFQ